MTLHKEAGALARSHEMGAAWDVADEQPVSQVLCSNLDRQFEELATHAQWPADIEISFVEDVFDTLFDEVARSRLRCLIMGGELQLIAEIRRLGIDLPILALLGDSSVRARILALEAGSDDCLGSEFSVAELIARTRVLCRRSSSPTAKSNLNAAGISLCLDTQTASQGGSTVSLTPTETEILRLLMENNGRVVSADQIRSEMWGTDAEISPNLVCVHVANLRQKLRLAFSIAVIRTLRGRGYVFGG